MRLLRLSLGCLVVLLFAHPVQADSARDPLRLMPTQADIFFKVEQPRQMVELALHSDIFKQLQKFDAIRELYDSTNARRFYQLLAYFEKQLGVGRLEMLDRLAGDGAVLGIKFGPQPAPALLVVQAKDEQLLQRFVKLGIQVIEQELTRQEAKGALVRGKYRSIDTFSLGKDLHAAVAGSALLISPVEKALQLGLDLHLDGPKKSLAQVASVIEARKLVNPSPLAWVWLNLETIRNTPGGKTVFTLPRNDPQLTVLFGGWLEVARRAPFLSAGLYATDQSYQLSFRMPRGQADVPPELAAHVPPVGQAGSRPLLEPKGVLFSTSYFMDVSKFWEHRAKLLTPKSLQNLEDFDKNSKTVLAGSQFSKLLAQVGAYQRVVVTHLARPSYKVTPGQVYPAFAVVAEMREPESFSKRMNSALRAAALLATTQVKLKPVDETYHGRHLVGYRFPEDGSFAPDTENIRFNFSPCYVAVGHQFVLSSTLELGREMIDLLNQEEKEAPAKGEAATVHSRFYGPGGAEVLEAFQDRVFAQIILDQATSPEKAAEQAQAFIQFVRGLGILEIQAVYGSHDFHYDIQLRLAKSIGSKK